MERVYLFLDRSGKELLDIILLSDVSPTIHLRELLMEHADRFKTLIGHPADNMGPTHRPSQLEPLEASTGFVNWTEYPSRRHAVPVPKCLRHVQLDLYQFDPESLLHFTSFPNLESLFITIRPEPKDPQWDMKLRFERLRHLYLRISDANSNRVSTPISSCIEWLECPALVDLHLFYFLNEQLSEEMYPQLEASILRFRDLQKLQVDIGLNIRIRGLDASKFQDMKPSMFEGGLEFVHLAFDSHHGAKSAWAAAFTERFFAVFVPRTNLGWPYAQFPSPAITANLKTMHINGHMEGVQSALVAPEKAKLEFPFLEELYLRWQEPKWMNLLYAPRLTHLHIDGFLPSDLRHISDSIVSSVYLEFLGNRRGTWEIFLPPADKLEVVLNVNEIFHLNLHPSQICAVTINAYWNKRVACPPYWTTDYISTMLGNVTGLDLIRYGYHDAFKNLAETILSITKPLVSLSHLTLFHSQTNETICVDLLAQHLIDPSFLPKLETLCISEYPSWPDFFRYIQQRQSGFLAGHFQTALKRITIDRPVHGALLEYLRESLAGRYIGPVNMPPRRKGSKEWPARPFDYQTLDTDGLLCCYGCHKAGLEIGCTVSSLIDPGDKLYCEKTQGSTTVFAP